MSSVSFDVMSMTIGVSVVLSGYPQKLRMLKHRCSVSTSLLLLERLGDVLLERFGDVVPGSDALSCLAGVTAVGAFPTVICTSSGGAVVLLLRRVGNSACMSCIRVAGPCLKVWESAGTAA